MLSETPSKYLVLIVLSFGIISETNQQQNKTRAKFLILGGGLAGLSAAKNLADNGETDFLLLEASNRLGGRVKQEKFGDYDVEIGAQWLNGADNKDPIWKLAQQVNLDTTPSDYGDFIIRTESGTDVTDDADSRWGVFDNALDSMFDLSDALVLANPYKPDISQRGALSLGGWTPKTAIDYAIEYFDMDFVYGHSPEVASTRFSNIPTFGDFTEMIVLDQTGGLPKIVAALANEAFSLPDPRLIMNTKVTTIRYTDQGVVIETQGGITYTGDYVIVTFSLGVLKNNVVAFDPPLPDWKIYSITGATFVNDYPVYIRFPKNGHSFWDLNEYILVATERRGYLALWQNFKKFWPESSILQIQVSGNEAERLARMTSDGDLKAEIVNFLRKMYSDLIPDPDEILIPKWVTDPLFYGCYSDWSPAFDSSSHDALRAPIGRLYFAGEAYHKDWFGYLQGAYLSGVDETDKLLECIQDSENCEEYVPPYEARGCTYHLATNYDASAQVDDGSCNIPETPVNKGTTSSFPDGTTSFPGGGGAANKAAKFISWIFNCSAFIWLYIVSVTMIS